MKKLIFAVLLGCQLLLTIVCAANTSQPIAEQQLIDLLQQYTTYSANFTEATSDAKNLAIMPSSGHVMIKKPGLFFWETLTPNHQQVMSNGKSMWIYDVDLAQATQRPAVIPGQIEPAKILAGDGSELSQYFTIERMTTHVANNQSVFTLTAKQDNAVFSKITMSFQQGRLVKIVALNNLDQTSTFTFSNIQLNQPIDSSIFTFKPPKGVDVLQDTSANAN